MIELIQSLPLLVGQCRPFCLEKAPPQQLRHLLGLLRRRHFAAEALGNLSRWAFLLTFAGVGLSTNFRKLGRQGLKPFLVGAFGEIVIAGITLVLVLFAGAHFHL